MTSRTKRLLLSLGILCLLLGGVGYVFYKRSTGTVQSARKVVINEAVRTLLYLPLYHAKERGYFSDEGLDVEIVTGGTATTSFASLVSGEAQFSQADPMYVPISREKGARTKVVAQVVARIAVWGLSRDGAQLTRETLKGKSIATQPRPMTAFTYAAQAIKELGLVPDKDVKIIETQAPNEILPMLNGDAQFAFTLEPNASRAVSQGATVVYSCPDKYGDQIFTGLMTSEDLIAENPSMVQGVVNAYQRALNDLRQHPEEGLATAKKYFGGVDDNILQMAINRILTERVLPTDVRIGQESWQKASQIRVESGDLSRVVPMSEAVSNDFAVSAQQKFLP